MVDRDSPRRRFRATLPGEWVARVVRAEIAPRTVSEAIAVAFTRAVEETIGDDEALALEVGAEARSSRRSREELIARSLGMGRETLRLTVHGVRWIRLDETDTALRDSLIGRVFRAHLIGFGLDEGVLQTTQESGQESNRGLSSWRVGLDVSVEEAVMAGIESVEARVRDDLLRLIRMQKVAAANGRRIGTTEWARVHNAALTPNDESDTPLAAPTGAPPRVRQAGVRNLSRLIRRVLIDSGETPAYLIEADIARDHPEIAAKRVLDSLARQAATGQIVRVSRGVYRLPDDPEPGEV